MQLFSVNTLWAMLIGGFILLFSAFFLALASSPFWMPCLIIAELFFILLGVDGWVEWKAEP